MKFPTLLLLTLTFICCQNSPSNNSQNRSEIISEQIDSIVNSYYLSKQFSGSVLVADQGQILFQKEFGYKNLDSTKLIDRASVFEIASLSKQFTALLIMMLKEESQLDYDDKLTQFFPTLNYNNVTIRHLLTHTSGFSERQFFRWAGQNMDPTKIYTNDFILTYLEQEKPPLAFEPGSRWEYSNLGYFILGLIIERVSGKDYVQVLNEEIIEPLDMNRSGIFAQSYKGNEMDNYVFGKIFNPKDSVFIPSFGMAWSDSLYGGVGILSNTTDLFKWDQALYGNRLLPQSMILEAFESYNLDQDSSSNYGFGWFVNEDYALNSVNCGKRLDHYGLWPGYESSIVRFIDHQKTIIVLSNQSPTSKDQLVDEISKVLFQKQVVN